MYQETSAIKQLIESAQHIVILQPDNPDGDSLGSSLALEQIMAGLQKDTTLVCGSTIPSYLHYLAGWDRVENSMPKQYDLIILVDTSSFSLLENLTRGNNNALTKKPLIILDHHSTDATIEQSSVRLNVSSAAATAEVIYELSRQLSWPINLTAANNLAAAILSDSLGLVTDKTTARTIHIIAELVDLGVSMPALDNARRESLRKSPQIVHYKGALLERIEYFEQDRIAVLTIPWEEIEKYSPEYNPAVLAIEDMRLTTNTVIAVVFKTYPDNKLTGKIRTNYGYPIAARLAERFGGGGHEYASGFKLTEKPELSQVKQQFIQYAKELIDEIV